jgi:hypothetical protein
VASGATTRVRCVFDDVEAVHLLDEEDNSEPIETPQVALSEDEAPILTPEAEMQHVQTEVDTCAVHNSWSSIKCYGVVASAASGPRG